MDPIDIQYRRIRQKYPDAPELDICMAWRSIPTSATARSRPRFWCNPRSRGRKAMTTNIGPTNCASLRAIPMAANGQMKAVAVGMEAKTQTVKNFPLPKQAFATKSDPLHGLCVYGAIGGVIYQSRPRMNRLLQKIRQTNQKILSMHHQVTSPIVRSRNHIRRCLIYLLRHPRRRWITHQRMTHLRPEVFVLVREDLAIKYGTSRPANMKL